MSKHVTKCQKRCLLYMELVYCKGHRYLVMTVATLPSKGTDDRNTAQKPDRFHFLIPFCTHIPKQLSLQIYRLDQCHMERRASRLSTGLGSCSGFAFYPDGDMVYSGSFHHPNVSNVLGTHHENMCGSKNVDRDSKLKQLCKCLTCRTPESWFYFQARPAISYTSWAHTLICSRRMPWGILKRS